MTVHYLNFHQFLGSAIPCTFLVYRSSFRRRLTDCVLRPYTRRPPLRFISFLACCDAVNVTLCEQLGREYAVSFATLCTFQVANPGDLKFEKFDTIFL